MVCVVRLVLLILPIPLAGAESARAEPVPSEKRLPDAEISAIPEAEAFAEFDTTLSLRAPRVMDEPVQELGPEPEAIEPFEPITFEIGFTPLMRLPLPTDRPTDLRVEFEPVTTADDGGLAFRYNRESSLYEAGQGPASDEEGSFAGAGTAGEKFNRYSLDIEWNPAGEDAELQWLVVGGLHAIKADIGRLDDANLGITDAHGMVTIPTVGTGVRWAPAQDFTISTIARTQSVDSDASMINLIVSADLKLSPGVGLSAGYEFYESDLSVDNVQTSIDREGYFAKLTIRF